ncbi:MAG TPA: NAD+ synthase [Deltaproteobacteria bacterium]|nr:NAD+ synthase [Deltaproteobacteria bacterium]
MKIALAQINTTIGDFEGNLRRILDRLRQAGKQGAELVVFPELTLTGYPPKDLLDRPDFIEANLRALRRLTREVSAPACLVGFVDWRPSPQGKPLANAAALISRGKIQEITHKILLPTYDVFDEGRYFEAGKASKITLFSRRKLGLSICEDIWNDRTFWGREPYAFDPVLEQARGGADLLVNISASPYSRGKEKVRYALLRRQALRYRVPLIYLNLVGGNDDLVFDGQSMVLSAEGRLLHQSPAFRESLDVLDLKKLRAIEIPRRPESELVLEALIVGLQDYMRKCGFQRVVVGLSGGIDSALTAWIAARALGPKNVLGISMPSEFSSKGSLADAKALAAALNIEYRIYPIHELYRNYQNTLHYAAAPVDVALQNIQARIRGNLLMALSNREGRLLLSTGNKSELSVGYCTLYGDMAGGFALLSDVPKTLVYQLARLANRLQRAIPPSTLRKAPSAELAPHQKDSDDLPPYPVLDAILERYIEKRMSAAQIIRDGFEKATVLKVLRRLDNNEYKRRQAAPGIRVTSKAFGYGWRMPISSLYRVQA